MIYELPGPILVGDLSRLERGLWIVQVSNDTRGDCALVIARDISLVTSDSNLLETYKIFAEEADYQIPESEMPCIKRHWDELKGVASIYRYGDFQFNLLLNMFRGWGLEVDPIRYDDYVARLKRVKI